MPVGWPADPAASVAVPIPASSVLVGVPVSVATFGVGVPKPLFRIPLVEGRYSGHRWTPSRDGQRFLVNTPTGAAAAGRFIVVLNWTAELGRK